MSKSKEEIKFTDISILKDYMLKYDLELESDDPFSDQYANEAISV